MTSKTINGNALSGNLKPARLSQPVAAAAATLVLASIFSAALVVFTMVNDSAATGFLLRLTCWAGRGRLPFGLAYPAGITAYLDRIRTDHGSNRLRPRVHRLRCSPIEWLSERWKLRIIA
jgi:hypothetical protein